MMRSLSMVSCPRARFASNRPLLGLLLLALGLGACQDDTTSDPATTRPGTDPTLPGTAGSGAPDGGPGAAGGAGTGGGGGAPGTSGPPRPYVKRDVNHVLITGQSNSVANSGVPVLSTSQPYANVMFDSGVMPASGCDGSGCRTFSEPASFVALVEGDRFFNYPVETAGSGLANQATRLGNALAATRTIAGLEANHKILVSLHGRSGNTYWCLRKGGCDYKPGYLSPFEQGMKEVAAAKRIAGAAGQSYVVRAVAAIHGESDHYSYTDGSAEFPIAGTDGTPGKITSYADGLLEWQHDYETEIRALTSQAEPVPLFISQISGWNDTPYSKVAQMQLEAHERSNGKVILIGPSYALPTDQKDCRHFTNEGEQRLGEYFAKVYAKVVFEGRSWEPLRPSGVTRDGAMITVRFHVPVPPLVLDSERVAAIANSGFGWTDESGSPPAITNVTLSGADSVAITLASAPTAPGHLTYAQNQVPLTCIGSSFGARGNLRDSDATPSENGYELHNWAVHFDVAVP